MTDRYGRMSAAERRSAALMRLAYWGIDFDGEIPDGLVSAIRIARRSGATVEDMAMILGCDPDKLTGVGES